MNSISLAVFTLETDNPSTEEGLSVPAIIHLYRRILRTEHPLETDDSS